MSAPLANAGVLLAVLGATALQLCKTLIKIKAIENKMIEVIKKEKENGSYSYYKYICNL